MELQLRRRVPEKPRIIWGDMISPRSQSISSAAISRVGSIRTLERVPSLSRLSTTVPVAFLEAQPEAACWNLGSCPGQAGCNSKTRIV